MGPNSVVGGRGDRELSIGPLHAFIGALGTKIWALLYLMVVEVVLVLVLWEVDFLIDLNPTQPFSNLRETP